jgi:hypothetical protein
MIRGTPIDLALAIIGLIRKPHETFTLDQIKDVVNLLIEEGFGVGVCRRQDIYFIERRAMAKLGRALIRSKALEPEQADRLREILAGPRYAHVGGVQKSRYRQAQQKAA